MVDDPVTQVRNLLARLGHLLSLETLGLAGVVRSRQILIGGALGVFHRPVVKNLLNGKDLDLGMKTRGVCTTLIECELKACNGKTGGDILPEM